MRISVERERFADTIGWVLRSVSSRATLPALGGVLFDANGPELGLAGTDLELAGEATIDAKIDEKGSVVLPGRVLGEIARSLPEGAVRIESSGGQAKLYGSKNTRVFNPATNKWKTYSTHMHDG